MRHRHKGSIGASIVSWLSYRIRSYGRVLVALCINVPFLIAALSRYPDELNWFSLTGVYAALVFVGYYVLILLVLLSLLFLLAGAWPRLYHTTAVLLLALALYYFVVDGIVYR